MDELESRTRAGWTDLGLALAIIAGLPALGCVDEAGSPLPNPEVMFAELTGASVAISGDRILSGAPWSDAIIDEAGRALVYQRNGGAWQFSESIYSGSPYPGGDFGRAVDIDGSHAVVAAPSEPNLEIFEITGAVYFFEEQMGSFGGVAGFLPDPEIPASGFGQSVSISGEWAAVGAPFPDFFGGVYPGTVFLYRRVNASWEFATTLVGPSGMNGDDFGSSVSLDGAALLVGAPGVGAAAPDAGAAYLYAHVNGAWTLQTQLTAPDASADGDFGTSVGLSGDRIVIGDDADGELGDGAGAAYVYQRNPSTGAWDFAEKLTAYDGEAGDELGRSVAVDGNLIVVGARFADGNYTDSGAAYAYRHLASGNLVLARRFIAADGYTNDTFGARVDVSGDCAVIGAPNWDAPGADSAGATYVFCDVPEIEDPDP